METKKDPKLQLENKNNLFFFIGMSIALSVCISAFEWKSGPQPILSLHANETGVFDEIEIHQTTQPPPPKPPKPISVKEVVETENEEKLDNIEVDIDSEPVEIFDFAIPEPPPEVVEQTFSIVEQMPSPINGLTAFYEELAKKIKYPAQARRMGIEGRVFVQFVIDKEGNITDIQVVKGIGAGCDEEAARVLGQMPRWNPGKQRGLPVNVRMTLPVFFLLSN